MKIIADENKRMLMQSSVRDRLDLSVKAGDITKREYKLFKAMSKLKNFTVIVKEDQYGLTISIEGNIFVTTKLKNMNEIRCNHQLNGKKCNKLLMKGTIEKGEVEIQCTRQGCGGKTIVTPSGAFQSRLGLVEK